METKLVYLAVFIILIISCNNPTALTPDTIGNNEVTGIFITTETSERIAIWGSPNTNYPDPPEVTVEREDCTQVLECRDFPEEFTLRTPYPNPADGNMNAGFTLPIESEVSLWIESAYWVGENEKLPFRVNRPFQVFRYMENLELDAGRYAQILDLKSICSGGEAYPGFYRVFIKTSNGFFAWQDIYIYGPYGTNPPGLGDYGFYKRGCQTDLTFN